MEFQLIRANICGLKVPTENKTRFLTALARKGKATGSVRLSVRLFGD